MSNKIKKIVLAIFCCLAFFGLKPVMINAETIDLVGIAGQQQLTGTGNIDNADRGAGKLITQLLKAIFVLAGIICLAFLIIGAIEWITSSGDKGKLESARGKITNSIIGLIILASAVALFVLVQKFLGIEVLTFS